MQLFAKTIFMTGMIMPEAIKLHNETSPNQVQVEPARFDPAHSEFPVMKQEGPTCWANALALVIWHNMMQQGQAACPEKPEVIREDLLNFFTKVMDGIDMREQGAAGERILPCLLPSYGLKAKKVECADLQHVLDQKRILLIEYYVDSWNKSQKWRRDGHAAVVVGMREREETKRNKEGQCNSTYKEVVLQQSYGRGGRHLQNGRTFERLEDLKEHCAVFWDIQIDGSFPVSSKGVLHDESSIEAAREDKSLMYALARHYFCGDGVAENKTKAAEYYLKAAEQGHVEAQCDLAQCYRWGSGVEEDMVKTVHWYTKAAEQGHSIEAQEWLAKYLANQELYKQNAPKGDVDAQFELASMYADGRGIEQNYVLAAYWYEKAHRFELAAKCYKMAAEGGNKNAQYALGCMYSDGKGVGQDDELACKWFEEAAQQGHADAPAELAFLSVKRVADQENDAEAQFKTAEAFARKGASGKTAEYCAENKTKAAEYYLKAAEQGHVEAQCDLAQCYERGFVDRDMVKAVHWYTKAAEQGHSSKAQKWLAKYLAKQEWCKKMLPKTTSRLSHSIEAQEWLTDYLADQELYKQNAPKGDVEAQCELASMYEDGRGVDQDYKVAAHWYEQAANHPDPYQQETANEFFGAQFALYKLKAEKLGDVQAQLDLARIYELGYNSASWAPQMSICEDHTVAAKYYKMAAEGGNKQAQYKLADILIDYQDALEVVDKDLAEALKRYRQAAMRFDKNARKRIQELLEENLSPSANP